MAGSLFDQLKKSGLVNEHKAKQIKKQKYQQSKQARQSKGQAAGEQLSEAAKLAEQTTQKNAEKARQLNLIRQQQQAERAKQAELKQVIESSRLNGTDGDKVFNFADDNKVKTLNVNAKTHQDLISGKIRIARFNDGYVLVADSAVEKIEQRDSTVLITSSNKDESMSDEDKAYYAKFEIPDDIMW